ncbi:competence protein ComGB [Bacillus pakistanensis]|uniref:Competence protein ComGB n=1 Tax=Rossellomorea pakistanensis TaxID=992288 RepID=A0ABS2N9S6_9BACI|nr:competence type IV pilus assembly protein ComGB [Bacillus pakistanensis]MBM7584609.1 competence protein ComGB [Bacillus pakistanensis]
MKRKLKEQGEILIRLGELLKNGYTLLESIDFLFIHLLKGKDDLRLKIIKELQNGAALSEVLLKLGMSNNVCAQVYFAEKHGLVFETLLDSGEYLLKRHEDQEALKKVLQYPLILISILFLLLILLRKMLFPRFFLLYESLGYQPSTLIAWMMNMIHYLPHIMFSILLCILLGIGLYYFKLKKLPPLIKSNLLLSIPVICHYIRLIQTHFFSREFSYLLKSGMSINEALLIFENQSFRPLFQAIASRVRKDLYNGLTFPESLQSFSLFSTEFLTVIRHGETNGKLSHELMFYSDFCMKELENRLNKWLKIIQPSVFVFVGLFILSIYFSIMIPLFQVMQNF